MLRTFVQLVGFSLVACGLWVTGAAAQKPLGAAAPSEEGRLWSVAGQAQLRMLATSDEDASNDRELLYTLLGRVDAPFMPGLYTSLRLGLQQQFNVEPDESGFRFQGHPASVRLRRRGRALGTWARRQEAALRSCGFLYFPTSRQSQIQDLNMAFEGASRASVDVIHRLRAGVGVRGQFRWHEYAERAGFNAGMNTKFVLMGSMFVSYGSLRTAFRGPFHSRRSREHLDQPLRVTGRSRVEKER